ncbi:uncharacterized protein [Primulina huaijiensis]
MCLQLPSLQGVYLSFNEIHGQIPSTISACSQLQTLSLSNNNFIGTIPPEIVNLEMLDVLYLGFNKFTGPIPSEIGKLRNLQFFAVENNLLSGSIPSSLFNITSLLRLSLAQNKLEGILIEEFGNLTTLMELYLGHNHFTGVIPQRFSELKELAALDLGTNGLSGFVPPDIFNISTLILISLTGNYLSGKLPSNIGNLLPNLEELYLGANNFDGVFPNSISNCSELTTIDLSENKFTGPIPDSLGNLRSLQLLNLETNNFTSESMSPELSFLNSLTNCRQLTELAISYNPLNAILPSSVGNLSSSLHTVYASDCKITGYIPNEIGNLSGLASLYLYGNELSGFIPETLDGLWDLQRLSLGSNRIRGYIPSGLCKLKNLGALYLSQNLLIGSIPECLGNVSSLRDIDLSFNNLTSDIPASIWNLQNLLTLDISSNSFTGSLSPLIGNLKVATSVNVSMNQLSDDIPATLGDLQSLIDLSLAHNRFRGSIPESIGNMLSLVSLDISYNNISGAIPKSLEALKHLVYFNVSFNQLSGEIPTDGPFHNFTSESFMSNVGLCGPPMSSCRESKHKSKVKQVLRVVFILLGIAVLVSAVTFTLILIKNRRKPRPPTVSDISSVERPPKISYHDLLQATNGYSDENFLGKGSFGSVYKGVMRDGTILAIKVFNMELEGVLKTFDVECEVLRNLRHRNLTKVISSCSNQDFRALVLEYMPNGSLEKWLHSDGYFLNIIQRLSIMIDVASALEYLHHGYSTPVVHCDLKPSNVLIDENMVAHVSDFGIAKFLGEDGSITHTRTMATLGYMAPEYGLEGMVSTRCDVYSYGVMLLETFTRKRPSDEKFDGDLNLKKWVKNSQSNALSHVIDVDLTRPKEENFNKKLRCLNSVLELALNCMAESPGERMNMKDVLAELKKIKLQLMSD